MALDIIAELEAIKVVSREGLVTMKTRSGRPQDLVDIERLQYDDEET
ncbi:MAG: hypothetical protein AB7T06_42150 [Kofleriaceae bacterium]